MPFLNTFADGRDCRVEFWCAVFVQLVQDACSGKPVNRAGVGKEGGELSESVHQLSIAPKTLCRKHATHLGIYPIYL